MQRKARAYSNHQYGTDWYKIRQDVLHLAQFKCAHCFKAQARRVRLQVHHIVPFRISKDNNLANLAALCFHCHQEVHRNYRVMARQAVQTIDDFRIIYYKTKTLAKARIAREKKTAGLVIGQFRL